MATAVKMFSGSRQPGRISTVARPPAAVDRAARATQPARSGGVWVNSAMAATWSATQLGRASTGRRQCPRRSQRRRRLPLRRAGVVQRLDHRCDRARDVGVEVRDLVADLPEAGATSRSWRRRYASTTFSPCQSAVPCVAATQSISCVL